MCSEGGREGGRDGWRRVEGGGKGVGDERVVRERDFTIFVIPVVTHWI